MDFKSYIEKHLLEIGDLQERRVIREAVQDVLVQLHQMVQDNTAHLEEKLHQEEMENSKQYEIQIGIVERSKYDVTDKKMTPMLARDLDEPIISFQEVREALVKHEALYLFSVFIQADYIIVERLLKNEIQFEGVIQTEDGEYQAKFVLEPALEYFEQIQELYKVFAENGIKWNTPCGVYLKKMFKVYLVGGDEVEGKNIHNISIDFCEYTPMIRYNVFPIWNIRYSKEKSSFLPVPSEGGKMYRHKIFKERLMSSECLAISDKNAVYNLYKQDGDLVIISDSDELAEWTLISFMQEKSGYYADPIFTNRHNLWGSCGVRTLAEVRKFVKNLGYESYVCLKEILRSPEKTARSHTYLMDTFLVNELLITEELPVLYFVFKEEQPGNYLNWDILSYIVTRIQWEYPQFRCIGVLQ